MEQNSHMPFLTQSPSGERVLFFCQSETTQSDPVIWKMYVQCGEQEPFRLQTMLPETYIECSPAAWHDDSGWHVSFIGGGDPKNPAYHLYRMDGVSLQRLSQPVAMKMTRLGFVHKNRLVSGDKLGNVFVFSPLEDMVLEFPKMELLRLSYQADSPDILLITARWPDEDEICTVAYDLKTCEQFFVEADSHAVYKPTLFGDELLYAEKVGSGFEERRIQHASKISLVPCKLASLRPQPNAPLILPNIESTQQLKPSDLSGVEKHLGAAYAMADELTGGHAYRLFFIGHLVNAEEESQSHPNLHQQIRKFRKRFQKHGIIPDWQKLADMLYREMEQ